MNTQEAKCIFSVTGVILRLSRHLTTMIDGVLHDTYDCTRGGQRCVYGYFIKEEG